MKGAIVPNGDSDLGIGFDHEIDPAEVAIQVFREQRSRAILDLNNPIIRARCETVDENIEFFRRRCRKKIADLQSKREIAFTPGEIEIILDDNAIDYLGKPNPGDPIWRRFDELRRQYGWSPGN